MYTMSSSIGNFSKFVAILLAFSVIGNAACSLYSLSISMQTLHPWLVRVPRYLFSIIISVIIAPISVVAATNFYSSLSNFLGLIGYWTAAYTGIALAEHHYFRKGNYESYQLEDWNIASKLPHGIAAFSAFILCFGLIIPSMDAVWFVGPIAEKTGDLGIEFGLIISALLYVPLRIVEIRVFGK